MKVNNASISLKKIDQNLKSADLYVLKQHLRCMEYEKRIGDC